uniref:SCP domain-containing protein n=1 Tax=Loa loa TaxID=7209 RepID=A0A1I7VGR3_LOALO
MLCFFMFAAIIIGVTTVEDYQCEGGQLTPKQREAIVEQNNKLRSQLIRGELKNKAGEFMPRGKNVLKMRWSCSLEHSAQKRADRCVSGDPPKEQRKDIGENIYDFWSSAGVEALRRYAGTNAGKKWWSELSEWYRSNPSNNLTAQVSRQGVLHFTQMAWGKTYKIGCGIATKCNGGRKLMVVCHYRPAGNMRNKLIYELGEPCRKNSDCHTEKCSV